MFKLNRNSRGGPESLHRWNPYFSWPLFSLALTALALMPLFWKASQVRLSSDARVMFEADPRHLATYEKARELLEGVEVVVVSMEAGDVFTREALAVVRQISESFLAQPGVVDVKSFTHSSLPVRRGFGFRFQPLISESPTLEEIEELRAFALEHPLVRDVMVSRDARHTLITVTYRGEFVLPETKESLRRAVDEVVAPFRTEGWSFEVLALPVAEAEIRAELERDVRWFVPAALLALAGILRLTLRSWQVVALAGTKLALVLAALAGLLRLGGFDLNLFTLLLLPLWGGIHLTLLAHIFTAWEQAVRARAPDPVLKMLEQVFQACAFAALTTGVGLLSLGLSEVRQVREFGLLGAGGIALIFFAAFGPGLSLLQLLSGRLAPRIPRAGPNRWPIEPGRWAAYFVRHRRRTVWAVWLILLGALLAGMARVSTDVRAVDFLSPQSGTRRAIEHMDRVYGGINVLQLEADSGQPGGANDFSFLHFIEELQRFAESQPEVSATYSYPQLLAMMNQIWEGGRKEALRLPENPLVLKGFVLALSAGNFPLLTALADAEFRTAYLAVRTPDLDSGTLFGLAERIVARAEELAPSGVSVSVAGGMHTILEADRNIRRSQVRSAGMTLGIIGLVLALLWRSLSLAGLALLTNAIPVGCTLAALGFLGIPLNSMTVMVAAIAFGIAVDDAVHFVTHWRAARAAGADDPLLDTFRVKGPPIVCSSLVLVTVFSLFAISLFPPVRHFGLLGALAFAGALAAILLFLPACLSIKRAPMTRAGPDFRTFSLPTERNRPGPGTPGGSA